LAEPTPTGDDKPKLTRVGCLLTLLTIAVILGAALPIVQWRDGETGKPLPRMVAVAAPFVIGAVFFGISTALLRLVGLRIHSESRTDETLLEEE